MTLGNMLACATPLRDGFRVDQVMSMPALSPTMEKGNLATWYVKPGDKIAEGQVLADVETDKATVGFETTEDGVVAKLLVPAGTQDVAINTPVLVVVEDAAHVDAFKEFKVDGAAAAAAAAAAVAAPATEQTPAQPAAASTAASAG